MKYKLILASHGGLAEGMHSAAEMIMGPLPNVIILGLDKYESTNDIFKRVEQIIYDYPGYAIIILCDIIGSSIHNKLLFFAQCRGTHVYAGMNLPMILEILISGSLNKDDDFFNRLVDIGKDGISYHNSDSLLKIVEKESYNEKNEW